MTTRLRCGWLGWLALLAGAVTALGQTNPAPAAPVQDLSPTERWIKNVKDPAPWVSWGADLRLRNEYYDNAEVRYSVSGNPLKEQDYFRFRARLWASVKPIEDLSLNVRLATEPREWMRPASYSPFKGHPGLDMTEGMFDNANIQWKNPFGLPAKLTVGRQDLLLGDGWLFGDGTPYDGSWTYYLDAARLTYELAAQKTTIDAIGIVQYARDDAWMPTVNNQDRYGSEQDEKGAVLWVANKSVPLANLDGYFVYKHDTRNGPRNPYDRWGDNADIYTLGGRLSGVVKEHWKYSLEGAYQFGQKQDAHVQPVSSAYRDLRAFGLNSKLSYLFKDPLNNQLSLCYEYLSGDNAKTPGRDEMFDVLWGRWPRWSELYNIYSYVYETRVGQTANLHRVGPGWSLSPTRKMDLTFNYNALFADQSDPSRRDVLAPNSFTRTGNFRGHFLQAVLKYRFSPHMTGHLWAEFIFPGDFYVDKAPMTFLRAELMFTF
jgi:hypothetical protein